MTSYEESSESSDAEECDLKGCVEEERHIHCKDCEGVVLEDDIHPECDLCDSCRMYKEQLGEVYCCSRECDGKTFIWDKGELKCNDQGNRHFFVDSCNVTEKHGHCSKGSCGRLVLDDDFYPECYLCNSCRIEEESRPPRCDSGCTSYDWCMGMYVCYCDY